MSDSAFTKVPEQDLGRVYSPEVLKARYKELCDRRDKVNASTQGLKKELEAANLKAEQARLEAMKIAAKISEARGGAAWITMKKEIGILARALGGK